MEKVQAYLNHGRWLVDCPKHGHNGTLEVQTTDTEYIAPCCYPGVIAQFTGMVKNRIQNVPDISARTTASARARSNGDVYEIVFPENIDAILEVIGTREIIHQNWIPGEDLDFLVTENQVNGVI